MKPRGATNDPALLRGPASPQSPWPSANEMNRRAILNSSKVGSTLAPYRLRINNTESKQRHQAEQAELAKVVVTASYDAANRTGSFSARLESGGRCPPEYHTR
jgi:hypothetical protein